MKTKILDTGNRIEGKVIISTILDTKTVKNMLKYISVISYVHVTTSLEINDSVFIPDNDNILALPSETIKFRTQPIQTFWDHIPQLLDYQFLGLGVEEKTLEVLQSYTSELTDYGCWCRPKYDTTLKGSPIDEIDKVCYKFWRSCLCNEFLDSNCGIDSQNVAMEFKNSTGEIFCSKVGDCEMNACRSFTMMVDDLITALLETAKANGVFNPERHGDAKQGKCKNGRGGLKVEACCGVNPTHFPFKPDNGRRQCCGGKTIDTTMSQCCGDQVCPRIGNGA